jgi:hypothetical protein
MGAFMQDIAIYLKRLCIYPDPINGKFHLPLPIRHSAEPASAPVNTMFRVSERDEYQD